MRVRSFFASAATVALTASVVAPASADTDTFKDKHGDLNGGYDIRSVRVDNDGRQISIRSKHRNLRHSAKHGGSVGAYIDISPRRKGPEYIIAGGVGFNSDYNISKVRHWKMVGPRLRCGSLKFHINYKRDTVRMAASRRCLSRSYDQEIRRIRVAVLASQNRRHGNHPKVDWAPKRRHFLPWVHAN